MQIHSAGYFFRSRGSDVSHELNFGHQKGAHLAKSRNLKWDSPVDTIYESLVPQVWALCLKGAKSNDDLAKELNQRVWDDLLKIIHNREKLKSVQNIGGYLHRSAWNVIGEFFRSKTTRSDIEKVSIEEELATLQEEDVRRNGVTLKTTTTPYDILAKKTDQASVRDALQTLQKSAPRQALMIKMRFGFELSDEEIATVLKLQNTQEVEKHAECLKNPLIEMILRLRLCGDFSESQIEKVLHLQESSLLQEQLAALEDPLHRKILQLKIGREFELEEVAAFFGLDAGTVKSQVHWGKQTLSKILKPNQVAALR